VTGEEPTRYFFVHLQKTAGTTLSHRLMRHFGTAEFYPNDSDGNAVDASLSVDHLLERWAARGPEIRMVRGHFPLCTTELLGAPFTTMTVLREPVERTLSLLRHHKRFHRDDTRTLEQIYDDPFRFHGQIHNHMVKMLSLTTEEMTGWALTEVDFRPEHLARATAALDAMDVVGLQDDLESFCAELTRRFGWDLGEPAFLNQTDADAEPATDAFRQRIATDNALDQALWEHAQELVARRAAASGAALQER
jgi:hypothetical protein